MFFFLSKLLNFFLSPITWIFGLWILSHYVANKYLNRSLRGGAILIFVLFSNDPLLDLCKYKQVESNRYRDIETLAHYDVAIVMGGFAGIDEQSGQITYEKDRAGRLWEAVRLWHLGVVDKILITGDDTSYLHDDGRTTAPLFLDYMSQMGVPSDALILEQHARNTQENAIYTKEILIEMGILNNSQLLISSAQHIQRAYDSMTRQGIAIETYPVGAAQMPKHLNHRAFYPSWEVATEWQLLLNEYVGNIVYKILNY